MKETMTETTGIYYVVINLLTYRLFTRFPLIYTKTAGSAAALSALFSGTVAFLVIWLLSTAVSGVKNGIVRDSKKAFGRWGKYMASIISAAYLFVSGVVALNEIALLIKVISFPNAPIYFVMLFLVIGGILGAFAGETSANAIHKAFVPVVTTVIVLAVASTVFGGSANNLTPYLGKTLEGTFGKGLLGTVMYTDIAIFFMIKNPGTQNTATKRRLLTTAAAGIFISIITIFAFNLSIPHQIAEEGQFPLYLLMKEVYYGRFFQRIDAIVLFASAISCMLYLTVNIGVFSKLLGEVLQPANKKAAVLGYGTGLFVSVLGMRMLEPQYIKYAVFMVCFAIIATTLIVGLFLKRRSVGEGN